MPSAARQLRHVLRSLSRSPLFSTVAILTLALGIGANTAVFSVVNSVLLEPLPFEEPERLVGVWHTAPGFGWDLVNQSPALYFTYREESKTFEDTGMWATTQVAVTSLAEPEQVLAMRVTDGIFPILGSQPHIGRLFSPEDDSPGTPETVILSHAYWQRRLGGERAVVGQTLTVDGRPREIIGVMRPDLHFLDYDPDLFLPFRIDRAEVFFGNFSYQGIARLRPGTTIAQANAEMVRLIPMAVEKFPLPEGFSRAMLEQVDFGPRVRPLREDVIGDIGKVLWLLLGTGALVLLVACANVANLLLVRADVRRQELAIRSALGAGRGRIARGLLGESLVLGVLGGAGGLGLAQAILRILVALEPEGLPRLDEIAIDLRVLLFTVGISVLAALAFAALPILRLRATSLATALKEGGRGASAGRQRNRARNVLVTAQIAVALVLLIGSGLMIRSFRSLVTVDPGFDRPEEVLTLRLSVPEAEVEDPVAAARLHEAILGKLRALPGIASVGLTTSVTMDGWRSMDPIFFEDLPLKEDQMPPLRRYKWISPGYFETMGNPMLVGRPISWADIHERARVAVITESLAREVWSDPVAAVGRRIRNRPGAPWREIVGVVGDVRDDGLGEEPTDVVFWPMVMEDFWDEGIFTIRSMAYVLRSERVGTGTLLEEVRNAVWSVNSHLPLASVRTLQEILRLSTARTSFTLVMLGLAAATALLLGAIGIYGVTSYAVSQRTREIGVRMAFGARPRDVSRLVLRHGLTLTAVGVVGGSMAALALTRFMGALLFGVSPVDPLTYAAASLGVALLALVASYLPARRAAGVDPMETLRWQ